MPPRKKMKRARRKFTGVNVLRLAETYAITNIWTQAAFNTNPIEFVTGFTRGTFNPGQDGSTVISLPELLGAGPGGFGGNYGSTSAGGSGGFSAQVASNIGGFQGAAMAGLKTAGVSIGFRLVDRITRRPRSLMNSQLRSLGMGDMVRV